MNTSKGLRWFRDTSRGSQGLLKGYHEVSEAFKAVPGSPQGRSGES